MELAFTKMNGAGNDFVLLDNRGGQFALSREEVARICHRQRGVGADGLILLRPCVSGAADWAWEFFNSDGSTAEMCGNGARCFARYVQRVAGAGRRISFETQAGVIHAEFCGERVRIGLTDPQGLRLHESVATAAGPRVVHSLNTGVPHAVVFVEDADEAMVQDWGRELRWHAHFAPRGTNVNFVQRLGPSHLRVRTYERGVEGETLACGTGVSASAIIACAVHGFAPPVRVQVQGGDEMEVSFSGEGGVVKAVQLLGPADFTFEGRMTL